jgi:hypothetical protein
MLGEFGPVAAAKFGKARRLMAIPFA